MVDVTIRAGLPADADAIARVQVASWRAAYRGLVPDAHLDGLDWRERAAVRRGQLARAADEGVRVHVAVSGESLAGFVATGPERDGDLAARGAQEVYAIYVAPRDWGKGFGRGLLGRAVDDVPPEIACVLWVLADNQRAREFYERQGFWADGSTKSIQIGGHDLGEVRYRLDRSSGQVAKPSDR